MEPVICDDCGDAVPATEAFSVSLGPTDAPLRFCSKEEVHRWVDAVEVTDV